MEINESIARFFAAFEQGGPVEREVEYLGTYLCSGKLVTKVLPADVKQAWSASLVPDHYMPLYDMKVGETAKAGGLFSGAPFAPYDPDDLQYAGLYLPIPSEPLFDFCTDNCGSAFWLNKDLDIFGRNLNNKIQHVGPLANFVVFAIDRALSGENWYTHINNQSMLDGYRLTACEGFD